MESEAFNLWGCTVLLLLVLHLLVHGILGWRQVRHIRTHADQVPEPFRARIKLADHRNAAAYTIACVRLEYACQWYSALLLLLWTFSGGLQWLHDVLWHVAADSAPWFFSLLFLSALWGLSALLQLPWNLVRTFHIEQRFGFNRISPGLFFSDGCKVLLLMVLLGMPLLTALIFLANHNSGLLWLQLWLLLMGVQLFMSWGWPTLIAPLFNRFRPLQDAALRQRIEQLLERNGFHSNGIFVMDGSARSTHGNAYFTGFGAARRIVFFDTLIDRLSAAELEAILAHELGHFKCRHIRKRLLIMALLSLLLMLALTHLLQAPWFYTGLGVDRVNVHFGLALFALVMPLFLTLLQPLFAFISRRHEYEADRFAAAQTPAQALQQALVTLYRNNANTLTPDSWYSTFHHSQNDSIIVSDHDKGRLQIF